MDHEDFEFPPDPATEQFDLSLDSINNIPLRVLSNTPIEQLPPTVVPQEQQRPIRQAIRGNRQAKRPVHSTKREASSNPHSEERVETISPESVEKGVEPEASPKNVFPWNKRARFDWTEEELTDFYKFLSQYGTDFNAIAVLFTGRSREDVKRLYHRELRNRREDVRVALESREEIDLAIFKARLKKKEELQQGPMRNLDQAEEEALLQIEAGALQLQPKQDGNSAATSSLNADFDFGEEGSEETKTTKKRGTKRAREEHSQVMENLMVEDVGDTCGGGDEVAKNLAGPSEPLEEDFFGFFE